MAVIIVFLWIFYSSVIYSALWRQFTVGKNLFLESILYPRAVEEAFHRDIIVGLGVCILPLIFATLAFVFEYYFSDKKFYIAIPLLMFAFTIDSYLAYKITERIYQISHTTFQGVAAYSLALAFSDINFWILIFLGFGLYIFLGFVYHIYSEAYRNIDKVKKATHKRVQMISQLENEISQLKDEIGLCVRTIDENKRKLTAYRESLSITVFRFDAFEGITGEFALGWNRYLTTYSNNEIKDKCTKFYEGWIRNIEQSLVPIRDLNQ